MKPIRVRNQLGTLDPIFQQAPIGILHLGFDGGILNANSAFCQLLSYPETQIRRLDNHQISHPEDLVAELHLIQQMVTQSLGQQMLQKRYLRRDGTAVWTEARLSIVGEPETTDSYLLVFVTDLSDRKQAEQEIQQRREREALLNEIAAQLRLSFDPQTVLQVAVERLRPALGADRVIAYQFFPDLSGICLAEARKPIYPAMLGLTFPAECMPLAFLEAYRLGQVCALPDIRAAGLADYHCEMLENVCVRSMLVAAIVSMDESLEPQNRTLWGLLVVHQCHVPRLWSGDEQQLVQAVANQIAMALEQIRLLQELQHYTAELEERVKQRTRSLERSLQFEQLNRHLTETLHNDLHPEQMLQAAVAGLVQVLDLDGGIYGSFDLHQQVVTVQHEFFRDGIQLARSLVGQNLSLAAATDACCQSFLHGHTCSACIHLADIPELWNAELSGAALESGSFSEAEGRSQLVARIVCPISDEQGMLGILCLLQLHLRQFEPDEIKLIEQVANQCAIALRQAHLYQQEQEQRLSAAYFRSFLAASMDVYIEYDRDCRYVSINPAGCHYFGRSAEEIIGKTNRELLGTAGETIEVLLERVLSTGERVFVDHELATSSGIRVFETLYTPIGDRAGGVQRIVGMCRDITEMQQQWQLLEHQNHQLAETTRLKQEFVATTSHELRTPLTAILGFSNVLLQEFFGNLNDKQKDYLERIHASGQHLLALINDILDLSRLEADRLELNLEAVFVPDLCENVILLLHERALSQGLDLQLDLEPDLDWIVADPRRLKQMLLNLLTNAVKFTPSGSVGLRVSCQASPAARSPELKGSVRTQPPELSAKTIHFQVWDTGIGIDEAKQHLIFSPFFQVDSSLTRKHEGTGLGLVITRKLAELHGGTVKLESQANQGSQFTIVLPLRVPAPAGDR
jgi:PAS domain S-box-containing protein